MDEDPDISGLDGDYIHLGTGKDMKGVGTRSDYGRIRRDMSGNDVLCGIR